MPVDLFTGNSAITTLSGSGLANAPASSSSSASCCCPSSTVFLDTLTTKLIAMTRSLQQQFEDLKKNQVPPSSSEMKGSRLAELGVGANVSVKYAYYIYVQRYGPPVNGVFDPLYIDLINAEIALGKEHEDSDSD